MKRMRLELAQIAAWENLGRAAHRAAIGKRHRHEVQRFMAALPAKLATLQQKLLAGEMPRAVYRRFQIWDPKARIIHAPCFEDRVAHHAVMALVEPVLDSALIPNTFACRKNKGSLAAVVKAQSQMGRWPIWVKADIRKYFDSIDHHILLGLLAAKFKGPGIRELFQNIIGQYQTEPGKGLPIGALPSQIFANYYLAGLDRYLSETLKVKGYIRYMDDMAFWAESRTQAKACICQLRSWLAMHRKLVLKENLQIQARAKGMTFLGYRVYPTGLRLNKRRKNRYLRGLNHWERTFRQGNISSRQLQNGYAAVHSLVAHANTQSWRQQCLQQRPGLEL